MHEFSITQNILEIVERHAAQAGAQRIQTITLVIGELSSLVDDAIQFYWDIIAQDSRAYGAQLVFKRLPARLLCQACQQEYGLNGMSYACPACGAEGASIVGGQEFFIESIDIETSETLETS